MGGCRRRRDSCADTSCGSSAPERKLSEAEAESLLPPLEAVPEEFGASGDEYAPRAYSEGGDSGVETAEFVERQTYMTEGLQNQYDEWTEASEIEEECLDALETYIGELEALKEEHSGDESTLASTQAVVNIRGESPEEFLAVQVQSNDPVIGFPVEEREDYERTCRERFEDAEVEDLEAGEMSGWLQETDRGEVTGVLVGVYGEHTTVSFHAEGTDTEVIRDSLAETAEYVEDQLAEIDD